MLDWNDLRYFLAVARDGSTLAAARTINVSQTTVARRIAALEQSLGLLLFEKRQDGYALAPAGEQLLEAARKVQHSATEFEEAAAARARDLTGTVRISMEEIYATTLFAPLLRELYETYPEILIEVDTDQEVRDLSAGEADVALRSTASDQPAGVVGRLLCKDDWTPYCSRTYGERHGVPRSFEELKHHRLIGGGGAKLWPKYLEWLEHVGLEKQVAMHQPTSTTLLSSIRAGIGIAVLPCIIADAEPDLIQCLPPRQNHGRQLWLVTHERVRHSPHVRVVIDFLYDRLSRHIRQLQTKRAA
ncbi:MAG TPA: LysR family transcriptional regulator [Sphingomicrobium sp.]